MTSKFVTRELLTPGPDGRFGDFGGRFVPETLVPACQELEAAFDAAWNDTVFRTELDDLLREYAGRPSILTECHNLGAQLGIRLVLKREDLNHTGSHKINSVLGQALLAKRMGKKRIIAVYLNDAALGYRLLCSRRIPITVKSLRLEPTLLCRSIMVIFIPQVRGVAWYSCATALPAFLFAM